MPLGVPGYLARRMRVYVDAKIVGMENPKNRIVYVGYQVEGTKFKGAKRVEFSEGGTLEMDDGEIPRHPLRNRRNEKEEHP